MAFNERGFGILIAFVIPGWVLLLGCGLHFPMVETWLSGSSKTSPAVGEFLYSLLGAVTLGMLTSTVRWMTVDQVLKKLQPAGITKPDFRELRNANDGLQTLVEGHYRYYQFHSNLLVASVGAALLRWDIVRPGIAEIGGMAMLWAILAFGAKDTFDQYHERVGQLLSREETPTTLVIPGRN